MSNNKLAPLFTLLLLTIACNSLTQTSTNTENASLEFDQHSSSDDEQLDCHDPAFDVCSVEIDNHDYSQDICR